MIEDSLPSQTADLPHHTYGVKIHLVPNYLTNKVKPRETSCRAIELVLVSQFQVQHHHCMNKVNAYGNSHAHPSTKFKST